MADTSDFWGELTAAALVGTARTSVPRLSNATAEMDALARLLAAVTPASGPVSIVAATSPAAQDESPPPEGGTPEWHLLISAGVTALWEQAGTAPQPSTVAAPEPAPDETAAICSPDADGYLARLLSDEVSELLPEWLAAAAHHGLRVSPARLPELFSLLEEKPELRELTAPVIGTRGTWLASQNPKWATLSAPPDADLWETGTHAERLVILRHVRKQDPAAGLALVEATWKQERAAERAALVAVLGEHPTKDDEPFLEAALDDRSRYVRAAAAEALVGLPDSGLVARQEQRAAALVRPERGFLGRARLSVALPEACDEAMARDGIVAEPPQGVGLRAWWLQQIMAAVPPGVWSREWHLAPEEIVRLADATEHARTLLAAWTRAATRAKDEAWATVLLQRWADRRDWPVEDLAALGRAIPQDRLETWLTARVRDVVRARHNARIFDDDGGLLELLQAHPYPWGEPLTRAFLDVVRLFAAQQMGGSGLIWTWQRALPGFAFSAAPGLVREAELDWHEMMPPWHSALERFRATLGFRQGMLQALAQSAAGAGRPASESRGQA